MSSIARRIQKKGAKIGFNAPYSADKKALNKRILRNLARKDTK